MCGETWGEAIGGRSQLCYYLCLMCAPWLNSLCGCRAQHLLNVGQTDLGKHMTAGRRYADGLSKVTGRLEVPSLSMINDFSSRDYKGPSESVKRFNPRDEMLAKLSTHPAPTGREPAAERPGAALRRRASMKPVFEMDVTAAIEYDLGEEARVEEEHADGDNMVRWGNDKTAKLQAFH